MVPAVGYPPKILNGTSGQLCPSGNQREEIQDEIDQEIRSLLQNILNCPGSQQENPASSCLAVFQCDQQFPSGYYWINSTTIATQVYCDMSQELCGSRGGWARIAHLDMTDPSQSCPSGWREFTTPKRACGITPTFPVVVQGYNGGYESVNFSSSGISYSHVCGKIIAFQYGRPNAFGPYNNPGWPTHSIDHLYLDGISVTYGTNNRTHIWSLAASPSDSSIGGSACPCSTLAQPNIPPWVGNEYFCESGSATTSSVGIFYPDDPLWDGQDCPPSTSHCCDLNNPPWFSKELSEATNEDIEVRVMANGVNNEDTPVELIEIYVK